MAKVTLRDVADAAGVSITTASFAMTGKGRISPEVRQKVIEAGDSLGYRKSIPPHSADKTSPVIGILFSIDAEWSVTFGFIRPILESIDNHFSVRDHTVALIPINEQLSSDEIFRRVDSMSCSGLYSIHYGNEPLFTKLEGRGIPVVLIMNGNFQNRFSTVCVDDFQGAYEGALHLLQAGHRKIIFIDIERDDLPVLSIDRFIGFKKAIEEFGIPISDIERITYDPRDHEYLRSRLSVIFGKENHPTAIFALDDDLAARSLSVLHELKLKVPRDVSLIAPGDLLDYSQEHCPQISTMKIDTSLMGNIACNLMEARLNHNGGDINVLKVKQQLILRGSTRQYDKGIALILEKKPSQLLPREKAMAAFNHIDTGAIPKWLGASPEFIARATIETGLGDEELRRRLGDDFRRVESLLGGADSRWRSPFGHERRSPGYGQPTSKPLLEKRNIRALRKFPWPDPASADISSIHEKAKSFHDEFAIMGGEWSPFWHDAIDFVGTQDLYYLMYDDPDFVLTLLNRIVDYYVAVSTIIFETSGKHIDIFFIGNDFGGQNGPLFTVDQFERFIVPSLKRLADLGHRYGKKVLLHSAGGIRPLIPAIIRSGVDALHGLQPDCAGMSRAGLKKDYGSRLCICGGIDAKDLLLNGSPETVRSATLELLSTFAPGGAYVASPSHEAIIADTPVGNVLALFDAVREFEESSQHR